MASTSRRERGTNLRRIGILVAFVVVLGLLPTCATIVVFPAGKRVAAPLVCPAETTHTVVVARWGGGSRPGSKSLHSDLYCLTAEGHGTIPSTPKLYGSLLAMWIAIVLAAGLVLLGIARLRARTAKGTSDAA